MPSTSRVRRWGAVRLSVALCPAVIIAALAFPHAATGMTVETNTQATSPAEITTDSRTAPTKHSSDGRRGRVAAPATHARPLRGRSVTGDEGHEIAPGVTFRRWAWEDDRGPVRAQLVRVDLDTPGVALDLLAPARVPRLKPLADLARKRGAVAAVNGDFFDIGDTGAPLGNARGRRTGLRSAAHRHGWTRSFWIDGAGVPRIGTPHLRARVSGKRRARIDQWNAPTVRPGLVGAYLPSWGRTAGRRVVDGQRRRVREVVVRKGRVRSNRTSLRGGRRIKSGFVLVGRGAGADRLRRLRPGTRARVTRELSQQARVLISGSVILRRHGRTLATDDRQMHPRTAIGIDRDENQVLLLVADGRHADSRGLTLAETADLMRQLGAEAALNLDGGGSSTMVAHDPGGSPRVQNRPSDGRQRPVPNGIGVVLR